MRNNRVLWPNVITRCASAEPTGTVIRYKGVRPNNNHNHNHAALTERFQSSTLHKLRQLRLYTNTDIPDTAHPLDDKAAAAEVTYTMTNTQPSCPGGGKSDRIPNTLKETMVLPQTARWKTAPDRDIVSLEKHGVFNLVPIISVPSGHKAVGTRWPF